MHTVIMVGAGLAVLAVFALAALAMGKPPAVGARWFLLPWLIVSLVNLYVGTTHGYTVLGELPFFVVVFGVPGLAALAVMRWSKASTATSSG
jgi:hypothetical protein